MGATLCAPIRSQLLGREGDERFRVGTSQMQGFRREMEDAHCVCLSLDGNPDCAFFGVYDGHSGDRVSKLLAEKLHLRIGRLGPNPDDVAIRQAVVDFDLEVGKMEFKNNGSTCCFVLVQPHADGSREASQPPTASAAWRLTAVNVGDSRAMLLRADGSLLSLTQDHKPETKAEAKRIRLAGGFVQHNRVDGQLAMSRAMGDYDYKQNPELNELEQKVIALPDITHAVAHQGDRLLIVCDGIVECATNKQVAQYTHQKLKRSGDPAETMRGLNFWSLAKGSTDNHSGVLVCLEDGTGYAQPEKFLAGPVSAWKHDKAFVNAYLKNAAAWGQTPESLPELIKHAEATVPKDWHNVGEDDFADSGWPKVLLMVMIGVLVCIVCVFAFKAVSRPAVGSDLANMEL